jgi:hypothetical protein
VEDCHSLMGES